MPYPTVEEVSSAPNRRPLAEPARRFGNLEGGPRRLVGHDRPGNEPARVRTAIVSWPKASFDDWWKQEKESISPVIDVPSHGYSSVDLSLHPCTDDTWSSIRFGVPEARAYHSALWTGSEMIVWGGGVGEDLQTGGRSDPATDTWLPTSPRAGVPGGHMGH